MASKVTLDSGSKPLPAAHPTTESRAEPAAHQPGAFRMRFSMRFSERRLLLMAGDIVATATSVLIGLYWWARHAHEPFTSAFILPQAYWFILLPALWFVLAHANDYYNLRVSARVRTSLLRLASITGQLLVIYLIIFFLSPRGSLPRRFIVYYAAISLVLAGSWRALRLFLIGWTEFRRRVLIVGGGRAAEVISQAIKEEAIADYQVMGCVSSAYDLAAVSPSLHTLGVGADLPTLVRQHGISEIVMAYVNEIPDDIFAGIIACYEQGTEIVPMTTLYEQITGRIPIEHIGEHLWALVLPIQGRTIWLRMYLVAKRLLDILFAVVGLVAFAVLLPLLAPAIKLDSPGPVFYMQPRLGQGGRVFQILKLRSMRRDAENDSGPIWAARSDTRITRVGKFLRKTRLDEVPQLVNVLRGEMSIVGPRPERPAIVDMLAREIPYYRARLAVKPGLTGWAQVRYCYGNSVEDALRKLQYDLYYIRHQSPALDVIIMVRTIGTMLLLRGT